MELNKLKEKLIIEFDIAGDCARFIGLIDSINIKDKRIIFQYILNIKSDEVKWKKVINTDYLMNIAIPSDKNINYFAIKIGEAIKLDAQNALYEVKYGKFKEELSQSLSVLFNRHGVDDEFQKKLCDNIYNTFNV